jgi:hypothetical protein
MSDDKSADGHGVAPGAGADEPTQPQEPVKPPKERTHGRGRGVAVGFVIGVATLLGVLAIFSVWANRLLFNPDNWSNTSTQLLQNPDIRSATANYITDQIYANVNVAQLLDTKLPPALQPLAGPAAGALRGAVENGVELALARPRVQNLWAAANRAADQAFIAIVEGGKGPVGVQKGVVSLNLTSIVDNVATRLGLPSDLGSKLPPSVGTLTIIHSNQLSFIQSVGKAIKGLALILTIIVPLLYLLAIFLARGYRRRTLMNCGFAIILAGVVALVGRHLLETQIAGAITNDATLRPAVTATIAIGTQQITEIASAFLFVGLIAVAAAWFAGPARAATSGRRALAPYLQDDPAWVFGGVAVLMLLIFIWNPIPATGKPAGMIVFLALALFGTEVLRRQSAEEFPDAGPGEAGSSPRGWLEARRERKDSSGPASRAESLPDQLERLSTLRDKGAISEAEYDSAKANLLHTGA